MPIDEKNFNYSWVIMLGVLFLSLIWYVAHAHRHYHGPRSSMSPEQLAKLDEEVKDEEKQPEASS